MKSKIIVPAMLALALGASGAAQAQTATGQAPTSTGQAPTATGQAPTVSGPSSATNNAVNAAPQNNSGAPMPGANSFTESQARDRIQDKGFTQVTDLKLDSQGIWRGKGTRNGQTVDVAMDYQGNVVPQ